MPLLTTAYMVWDRSTCWLLHCRLCTSASSATGGRLPGGMLGEQQLQRWTVEGACCGSHDTWCPQKEAASNSLLQLHFRFGTGAQHQVGGRLCLVNPSLLGFA